MMFLETHYQVRYHSSDAVAFGDLPSVEMPEAEDEAEGLEYLPSGKRSRTEAKEEEDVEMQQAEEQQGEEIPHDDPMEAPDFGAEALDDSDFASEEKMMNTANELVNSFHYEWVADEENGPGEPSNLEQRPQMATPQMARLIQYVWRGFECH